MAPKKKTAAEEEPDAKKAKVEEPKKEEPKKEEDEPKEKETDAKEDKRAKLSGTIGFEPSETSLNVLPMGDGNVLMCLTDGGVQHLIAGARANVGMKAGRYFYEVKTIEALTPPEGGQWGRDGGKKQGPQPRQVLRLGFSTGGSSIILGDGENVNEPAAIWFDQEGRFSGDIRAPLGRHHRYSNLRETSMAVLLNLDAKSPNFNTISLFKNGIRASEPMQLPEHLRGKVLHPHVCFRNLTLQVQFGPTVSHTLPFKCPTLQEAAAVDTVVTKVKAPVGGKHEVIFPVGIPDEGTFEWLDDFLKENPQYVEISDRMILAWARKSGFHKPWSNFTRSSNDKPDASFGVAGMDDGSVKKVLNSLASVMPRNYVVMEVKENLVAEDRAQLLKKFPKGIYKRVARVMMGEPPQAFKKKAHDKLLKQKQEKANREHAVKMQEKARKKMFEQRRKEIAAASEAAKKRSEEAKEGKPEAEVKESKPEEKKDEENKDAETKEEVKEEKTDEVKEEKAEENSKKEEEEEVEEDTEPPTVTLTEEEQKQFFVKSELADLLPQVLDRCFPKFTMPEKSEGFDEIKFEWAAEQPSRAYIKKYVLDKKKSSRIDDLVPGTWFKNRFAEFSKLFPEWQEKQKQSLAKKKEKTAEEDEKDEGGDVDIFSIADVCDVGNGEVLFQSFSSDDWMLLGLRLKLHTLARAYKTDVNDPDRTEIPEQHVCYYFGKYFREQVAPGHFGKTTMSEVCTLVKDTVLIEDGAMKDMLSQEDVPLDYFVKLTEEARRARQRRLDAGDETARLKLSPPIQVAPAPRGSGPGGFGGGGFGGGGFRSTFFGGGNKWGKGGKPGGVPPPPPPPAPAHVPPPPAMQEEDPMEVTE